MNVFDIDGTLSARAHKGLNASPIGLARVVALAIGIALSIATPLDAQASEKQIQWAKQLAKEQLTDKQEICHHEIVYRESRWNYKAVGNKAGTKQVYGLYQMKTESLKNSSSIKQFWFYYHYVGYRYGWTEYEDPNYCNALHHLKTKGWQ
jgi:phosphoglycolate phosphatase-like HAD superfamily hydrolase